MQEEGNEKKVALQLSIYGVVIDPRVPPLPLGLSHEFPTSAFLPLSPFSLPGSAAPPSAALSLDFSSSASADRPGCRSARDAMPEAAAGSSGKSFLQRARGKVLRWLRRSLGTTHQVKEITLGSLKIVILIPLAFATCSFAREPSTLRAYPVAVLRNTFCAWNIVRWSSSFCDANHKGNAKGQLKQQPVDTLDFVRLDICTNNFAFRTFFSLQTHLEKKKSVIRKIFKVIHQSVVRFEICSSEKLQL